jgi:hypothetical protein
VLGGYEVGQPDLSVDEYKARGYRLIIYAVPSIVYAAGAVWSLYQQLRTDGIVPATGSIGISVAEFSEMQARVERWIGLPKYYELEDRYSPEPTNE